MLCQGALKRTHTVPFIHVNSAWDSLQDGAVRAENPQHGICEGVDVLVVPVVTPGCTYERILAISGR